MAMQLNLVQNVKYHWRLIGHFLKGFTPQVRKVPLKVTDAARYHEISPQVKNFRFETSILSRFRLPFVWRTYANSLGRVVRERAAWLSSILGPRLYMPPIRGASVRWSAYALTFIGLASQPQSDMDPKKRIIIRKEDFHPLQEYSLGSKIAKGSYGVVYEAKSKDCADEESPYDMAVKILFNYKTLSEEQLYREMLPAQTFISSGHMNTEAVEQWRRRRLASHPYIVSMPCAFVDTMPLLPDGLVDYPFALPPIYHPDGEGRPSTLFLVMPRYTHTLESYLASRPDLDTVQRSVLLLQLLEAVVYLGQQSVAHRDIKANNVFVDVSDSNPRLVLADFGLNTTKMRERLQGEGYTERGGNGCLIAPELSNALPAGRIFSSLGLDNFLDYRKSDVWTCGTLAYEIFGQDNPFLNGLDNRFYDECSLPDISECPVISGLAKGMLRCNPTERLDATQAANALQIWLWTEWYKVEPTPGQIRIWLIEQLCQREISAQSQLRHLFALRTSLEGVQEGCDLVRALV